MGSKWRKAKLALGLNMCLYVPQNDLEDDSSITTSPPPAARFSNSSSLSHHQAAAAAAAAAASSPSSSFSVHRSSKSSPKPSKRTCAICLNTMKPGQGHAIFTAECSHSFHFYCVTSNVKHGNQICPVCRAKWKEIPFQKPVPNTSHGRERANAVGWPRDDAWMTVLRHLPPAQVDTNRQIPSLYHTHEPNIFDDDEALDQQCETAEKSTSTTKDAPDAPDGNYKALEVTIYPEVSAVARLAFHDNFTALIHVKAPCASERKNNITELLQTSQDSRAWVDLVTVLDVSGSMSGTKLALLKRAMGFVIQNLSSSDRLSVIAFSSSARRLFPLRRMTDTGKQEALQAVNSLASNGGTNIAEGLKKGAKVIVDRKWKNPVTSIILLSDGQDTYTVSSVGRNRSRIDYKSLLPASIHRNGTTGFQIPVHSFGFGADHDAASMHSISEISGGTFSFIEAEGAIQDAFAQCIGGLLSVVVQELQVKVECIHPGLQIGSIKAGSYQTRITADARIGSVDVGDLYAEEERDFLVMLNIPVDALGDEMSLLKVKCVYKDPISKDSVTSDGTAPLNIQRPENTGAQVVSVAVDRQRNRLHAAEAMGEARAAAENGELARAVSILDNCSKALSESASAQAGDGLCVALCAELREMQERMASRRAYEASGRAYVLSGLSSHSWQRATARGDSTDSTSLVRAYQTPTMVDMVTQSQTMFFGSPSSQRKLRASLSFPAAKPQPR